MSNYSYDEVMETAKRMHERYSSTPLCGDCPLGNSNIAHCRKVAFEHPDEFAKIVMEWGEKHRLGVNEFNKDQERQIDAVIEAAENLIRIMILKPDYLKRTNLKGWNDEKDGQYPILPSEIADIVADCISQTKTNVFFPVHIEEGEMNGKRIGHFIDDYVRDTYNDPICNE